MRKAYKILLYILGGIIFLAAGLYAFGYGYIFRAVKITYFTGHTTAFIDDHTYFENELIHKPDEVWEWPEHSEYNETTPTAKLDSLHKELGTAAFLIIKNDSIWHEAYMNGYNAFSRTNSFSMAKSIVTALMFKAIQDGYLSGIDQPVSDFYPQFDERLKIGDLASMASGLNWNENYYNPFGSTAQAYFDEGIRQQVLDLEVVEEPGIEFKYLSGNTQLLGMLIEKASGKGLSDYLEESFWQPLGMNDAGLWQTDGGENEMVKAYCCIASNARNFAKFGKLFMDSGKWNGQQLIDSSFISLAKMPRFEDAPYYGYGFWLSSHLDKDIFYMRGVLGQYVIMIPEDDLIIVRLGEHFIPKSRDEKHYKDFYMYIEEAYKMIKNAS